MLNLFPRNNIQSPQVDRTAAIAIVPSNLSSSKSYYGNRGLNNLNTSNNFVKHLTDTAKSAGLVNVGSKILHDNNQGATTWLLTGQEALRVFDSASQEIENKN